MKASTFAATTICVSFAFAASAAVITPEEADVISRRCQSDRVCEANLRAAFSSNWPGISRKLRVGPTQGAPPSPSQATTASPHPGKTTTELDRKVLPTLSDPVAAGLYSETRIRCDSANQALFVRGANSVDTFNFVDALKKPDPSSSGSSASNESPNAVAQGASVNYTDNRNTASQTATINARVSYLLVGLQNCQPPPGVRINRETGQLEPATGDTRQPFLMGLAFAPFVSANGTWNDPFTTTTTTTKLSSNKSATGTTVAVTRASNATTTTTTVTKNGTVTTTTKKTSTSALRFGADFQAALSTTDLILQQHYFYLSPFYQTDFRGLAQIGGTDISWQPISLPLHLGVAPTDSFYIFLWQFKAESELTQVSNPGYTDLSSGGHALFGDVVRANLALFPLNSDVHLGPWFDSWVAGRLSFIGTQQYYWDAASKRRAPYYSLMLQYKLGDCRRGQTTPADSTCSIQGSSSISLEYDWGLDKDTFVKTNQLMAKLSYSY